MTREELELHTKWLEVEERFLKAKAAGRDTDEYRAAKAEMNEMRVYWRQIREYLTPEGVTIDHDGGTVTVRPAAVRASGKAKG